MDEGLCLQCGPPKFYFWEKKTLRNSVHVVTVADDDVAVVAYYVREAGVILLEKREMWNSLMQQIKTLKYEEWITLELVKGICQVIKILKWYFNLKDEK